ncbi:NAD-dependent epimerase/dehydratase family protein [Saccharomonospora saliphila]|uniref:NAD-dependent epimerase/dehydratase family protein n=1 Tax=Saccharomonospora saliphila TaxID=369829 RepID=UPI00036DE8D3|nr:NAD-dependent epimerase/dehydratase family protein [Saccharomonospora saliphila]
MPPNVVLVTGVAGELGGRLLARLGRDTGPERVLGMDSSAPADAVADDLGRAEFVRADIRNPLISKIITAAKVDTVVHAGPSCRPAGPGRRAARKEVNVIGTMRLLAACQRSPHVRKLVVVSSSAVYGASARSQAVFTEDADLVPGAAHGYVRDAVEIEDYVRGFARRRPDVTVTTMRLADLIGAGMDTVFARYLALPVVPTVFGFDGRLQLLHAEDALAVLGHATLRDRPGVFNVAGDGVVTVSQAVRRAGRVEWPVPRGLLPSVGRALRGARGVHLSAENARLLSYGRVVDTTRLTREFGYTPRFSTAEALDDHVRDRPAPAVLGADALADALDSVQRWRSTR